MKPRWQLAVLLVAVFICVTAGPAFSQQLFKLQAYDKPVSVMSQQAYQKQFGNNPDIPGDHQEILNLARKLYKPQHEKFAPVVDEQAAIDEHDAGCREYELGLLFAALQNPAVSDVTREMVDSIILEAVPPLPKTYTSGKFKILYTSTDANSLNNITDAEAIQVAAYLNSYYNTYLTNFTRPKGYWTRVGREMVHRIDVKIYYIDASILGQTASSWNHIELNSSSCVKSLCKRKTTSAHELFHRVQYAYGYVTGTANMKWMVEGSAAWSQKFTNMSVRDYMSRMNSGLSVPDKALVTGTGARSYDACHLWTYLDEVATKYTRPTYPMGRAIKDVWATYSTNGKNAKAAVQTVAVARGVGTSFDQFITRWARANYCKDFSTSATWKLDYTEDESTALSCSTTYGPLSHVPKTSRTISSNATVINLSGSVSEYGADYYEFTIAPGVTTVKIALNGADAGNFAYELIPIKSGNVLTYYYTFGTGAGNTHTFTNVFASGAWDKCGLIVMGRSLGGSYTVRVGP